MIQMPHMEVGSSVSQCQLKTPHKADPPRKWATIVAEHHTDNFAA